MSNKSFILSFIGSLLPSLLRGDVCVSGSNLIIRVEFLSLSARNALSNIDIALEGFSG